MNIRITLIVAIVVLNCGLVNAQDSKEIERTYRKQTDVYIVNQRLWMTPSYGENGQVCPGTRIQRESARDLLAQQEVRQALSDPVNSFYGAARASGLQANAIDECV
jgi:hypothetical protein